MWKLVVLSLAANFANFVTFPAFANPPVPDPPKATATAEATATQDQNQAQGQDQDQAQTQTQSATQNASQANAQSISSRSLAFANGAPIPLQELPECWVPGDRLKRGHSILWGLWAASAIPEKDADCVESRRLAAETALLAQQNEAARIALELKKLESAACEAKTERVIEACVAK